VDLRELAEILAETVTARDQAKHVIGITGQARAVCDGRRLAQALTHVLTNALLYSPPESRISVNLDQSDDCVRCTSPMRASVSPPPMPSEFTGHRARRHARELGHAGSARAVHRAPGARSGRRGTLMHTARPVMGTSL